MTLSEQGRLPQLDAPERLDAFALDSPFTELVVLSWSLVEAALGFDGLTASERAVAELACGGLRHDEIAWRRSRSARTVANQLARAYRKLGVGSRAELVARFVRHGSTGERTRSA